MSQEILDILLSRMERIAAAINAFKSETVQQQAFSALMAAFDGRSPSKSAENGVGEAPEQSDAEKPADLVSAKTASKPAGKKRKSTNAEWSMIKDLDLQPKDKQSLKDFIEEKKPESNEDRYAVVVYYLEQILGISPISQDHVGTVFRLAPGWKEPTSVRSGLSVAAARKGTIDYSNSSAIKTTPTGRNFVEHDLPKKVKGTK
jgi:hypothetical protein